MVEWLIRLMSGAQIDHTGAASNEKLMPAEARYFEVDASSTAFRACVHSAKWCHCWVAQDLAATRVRASWTMQEAPVSSDNVRLGLPHVCIQAWASAMRNDSHVLHASLRPVTASKTCHHSLEVPCLCLY